jgi:DNA polymerase lambda
MPDQKDFQAAKGSGPEQDQDQGNPCPLADRYKCDQAHDGSPLSPDEHPNEWLAKKFDEMHEMYSGAKHKNDWQIRGYRNGTSVLDRLSPNLH